MKRGLNESRFLNIASAPRQALPKNWPSARTLSLDVDTVKLELEETLSAGIPIQHDRTLAAATDIAGIWKLARVTWEYAVRRLTNDYDSKTAGSFRPRS
jgi:hypothetical protein